MKRCVVGQDRTLSNLLAELLDEYISKENAVRIINGTHLIQ